ncbi:MAG: hypothetical protein CVV48_15640 [Spirochaetae bacterium HGW-Spirochaetae-4]|nr:MAG: hypothetical protein CVV48_15640 [Spirochaetae bacterium HGW-Spirochaetae-4]
MELIGAEFFSIIVVAAILFDRWKVQKQNSSLPADKTFLKLLVAYAGFLVIALFNHASILQVIQYPIILERSITIVHLVTFPLFILYWLLSIESQLLERKPLVILGILQIGTSTVYAIYSLADILIDRSYILDETLNVVGGNGFNSTVLLSVVYCALALAIIAISWKKIELGKHLLFFIVPLLLMVSMVFFHLFKHHNLFTLSTSFILLMNYMFFLRKRLEIDALTGVPNQNAFMTRLEWILKQKHEATVFVLDIENFRFINHRYGTAVGDALLQSFATYLSSLVKDADVFRIAGNRFSVVASKLSHNEIVRVVNRFKVRIAQPWEVAGASISFHVNVAIIELPDHAEAKDQVVDTLDFTLSEIKSRRRQPIVIYSKRLMLLRQRRLNILTALRNAISNESMVVVHYQPIYDTSTGHLVSAEALMRLQDDQLGLLMPGEFIPFAENTGLIVNLTEIMLRRVCTFLTNHETAFRHLRHISINVSAEDFSSSDMARRLLDIVDNSGVKASRLSFEMTESLLLESYETVKNSWGAFAQRGITLALDDFGTGYSNLEALVNMPFDIVKIDRSVVSNSTNNFELITLISVVLERLGKSMIAEGVETQEQVEFVRAAGIDCMQGYFFSKPVPEEHFLNLLRYDNAK